MKFPAEDLDSDQLIALTIRLDNLFVSLTPYFANILKQHCDHGGRDIS